MLTLTFGAIGFAALVVLLIGFGIGHAAGLRRADKLRRMHEAQVARRERVGALKRRLLPWRRSKDEVGQRPKLPSMTDGADDAR